MKPSKRARITTPRRRPGPKPKPKTPAEALAREIETADSKPRRLVSAKARTFIRHMAETQGRDARASAAAAGFTESYRGPHLAIKYRELIESETLRMAMGRQMELDEALIGLAELARTADDERVKHSSLRTVLEVHGALSNTKIPAGERGGVMRQIEEIVGAIKGKLKGNKGDNPDRVSRDSSPTRRRTRVAIEVEESNHEDPPTTTISVTPIRDQEDPH